jgi:hypothetical protein
MRYELSVIVFDQQPAEPSLNRGFLYLPKIGLLQISSRASTRKGGGELRIAQKQHDFLKLGLADAFMPTMFSAMGRKPETPRTPSR